MKFCLGPKDQIYHWNKNWDSRLTFHHNYEYCNAIEFLQVDNKSLFIFLSNLQQEYYNLIMKAVYQAKKITYNLQTVGWNF